MSESLHLIDATMFWSPTGGGGRAPVPADQARVARDAAALAPLHRSAAHSRRERERGVTAVVAAARQRRLSRAAAATRDRARHRRPRARPDRGRRSVPRRVPPPAAPTLGVPALAYCHSNLVAMARLAAGARLAGSAARVAERYARHLYRRFDLVLAPSRSMAAHLQEWGVERVACQPLGVDTTVFHPAARESAWRERHGFSDATRATRLRGQISVAREASRRDRRCGASSRRTGTDRSPSAPARRRRFAIASSCSRSSPRRASSRRCWRAPTRSSMPPATVRSASLCSKRWRAELRRCCATPKASPSPPTAPPRSRCAALAPTISRAAIATLFAGDRDARARAARARAEASDSQSRFPGLVEHYLRLLGERATASAARARSGAVEALQR